MLEYDRRELKNILVLESYKMNTIFSHTLKKKKLIFHLKINCTFILYFKNKNVEFLTFHMRVSLSTLTHLLTIAVMV